MDWMAEAVPRRTLNLGGVLVEAVLFFLHNQPRPVLHQRAVEGDALGVAGVFD